MDAIVAANYTTTDSDRVVLVPANHTFNIMPVWAANITNIVIQIDGTIRLSKRHHLITQLRPGKLYDVLYFEDVEGITFQGSGEVDGQGYMWWVRTLIALNHNGRPNLISIERGRNIEFSGVRWINSPSFHLELKDIDGLHIHDMEIHVDMKGQLEISKLLLGEEGFIDGDGITLPMFPFNTDGIDTHARNMLIERVNVTNFDDAVAVKPCH